jgi:hypothetical protein
VADGDTAADLAVATLNLAGAGIADAAGNALDLAGAAANPLGTLSIDTRLW